MFGDIMSSSRVLFVGFLLAFVIAASNGLPVDIETNEEVVEDPFSFEDAYEDLVEDKSTTTEQHLVDESDSQVLGDVGDDAISNDTDEVDGDDEANGINAVKPDNIVFKGLSTDSNALSDKIYINTGNSATGVSVIPYTSTDKLIKIQWPEMNVYDTIMAPITATTDVVTKGNRRMVGKMIYCKNPGELLLFNDPKCTKRTYLQGTGQSQELDRRTCRELRKEMYLLQEEADELAENLETMGGQTAQNIANSFGQSLSYGTSNPFGNSWALGPNNNLFGSGIPFGNNGVIQNSPFGTNPYGISTPSFGTNSLFGTNTSPLIPNNFPYTANTYPNNPSYYPYGNTYPYSNTYPFGSYNTSPIGNKPLANSNTSPLSNSNTAVLGNYNTPPHSNSNSPVLSNFNAAPFAATNTPLNNINNNAAGNVGTPYTATSGATNNGIANGSKPARRRRTGDQKANDIDNISNWLQ